MLQIPIKAIENQTLIVELARQSTQINLYQKSTGLFMDAYLDRTAIALGVLCQDRTKIIRYPYLGFIGDLCFIDNQGTDDPDFTGLGTRFSLIYLEAQETAQAI